MSRRLSRTSVSAAHTPKQIDEVLEVFAWVGRELGVLPSKKGQRVSSGG